MAATNSTVFRLAYPNYVEFFPNFFYNTLAIGQEVDTLTRKNRHKWTSEGVQYIDGKSNLTTIYCILGRV